MGRFYFDQKTLENELVALAPFDVSFCLGLLRRMPITDVAQMVVKRMNADDNARSKPDIHLQVLFTNFKEEKSLSTYISVPVIEDAEDLRRQFWNPINDSSAECLYAIIDKTTASKSSHGQYAGVASLSATDPTNAVTELGAIIFPQFHGTHVASNAVGLLLLWTLDPPSLGGLGLRRVVWQTHHENVKSRRFALRMGFHFEGIARWQRIFPRGEISLPVSELEKAEWYNW